MTLAVFFGIFALVALATSGWIIIGSFSKI